MNGFSGICSVVGMFAGGAIIGNRVMIWNNRLSSGAGLINSCSFFMKKDIHPKNYREVLFKDTASDFAFVGRSTAKSTSNAVWEDGKEYPVVLLGISSASHPFYTGQQTFVDTAGRVDKFRQRLAKTQAARDEVASRKTSKKKRS